jgi:hypothetical protein
VAQAVLAGFLDRTNIVKLLAHTDDTEALVKIQQAQGIVGGQLLDADVRNAANLEDGRVLLRQRQKSSVTAAAAASATGGGASGGASAAKAAAAPAAAAGGGSAGAGAGGGGGDGGRGGGAQGDSAPEGRAPQRSADRELFARVASAVYGCIPPGSRATRDTVKPVLTVKAQIREVCVCVGWFEIPRVALLPGGWMRTADQTTSLVSG